MSEENKSVTKRSIFGELKQVNPPESAKDPIKLMIEIAKDPELSDEDKAALISFSKTRFQNRRKMAYIALYTLMAAFILIILSTFIDGIFDTDILDKMEDAQTIIIWGFGFLTTIVGAYYGVSTFRPSS